MALTKADKEFIQMSLKPIMIEISGVKEHLARINGKILKNSDKIEQIEHDTMKNTLSKKFIVKSITVGGTLIAIIYGIIQLIGSFIS